MILDLTDEETEALARLLRQTIDDDRYPLSPRIRTLKATLAKIRPEPARALAAAEGISAAAGRPIEKAPRLQVGERRSAIPVLSMPEPLVQ
jgi:hypothetical protein